MKLNIFWVNSKKRNVFDTKKAKFIQIDIQIQKPVLGP
jgi:hypothetical protein